MVKATTKLCERLVDSSPKIQLRVALVSKKQRRVDCDRERKKKKQTNDVE